MYILKFQENSDITCSCEVNLYGGLKEAQTAMNDEYQKLCHLLGDNFDSEEDESADSDCQRWAQCHSDSAHIQVCLDTYDWEIISDDRFVPADPIMASSEEKALIELKKYQLLYGDIVFPKNDSRVISYGESNREKLHEIALNPAGWMYSHDGIHWKAAPMDIGKIDYAEVFFRRIPEGVTIGVSTDVRNHPELYQYSTDNGYSWRNVCIDDYPSGHAWIYHGNHASIWFKK